MAGGLFSMEHPWASAFGILGNIISFLVFLAPMPTFLRVYRKKSTEGFSSAPYVVALFSCTLWIFYALVKTNSSPLLTINAFGCAIESVYILLYLVYAPRPARLRALASFLLLDVAAFSLVAVVTLVLVAEPQRVRVLGSICLAFSMAVFVAPMSVIFVVIRTKSAEFMPFSLSFFLTLSAVAWFFYGLFIQRPLRHAPERGRLLLRVHPDGALLLLPEAQVGVRGPADDGRRAGGGVGRDGAAPRRPRRGGRAAGVRGAGAGRAAEAGGGGGVAAQGRRQGHLIQ